jgi:hypothetical protein
VARRRDDRAHRRVEASVQGPPPRQDRRVAARYHSRVRSSCRLVTDDWRVVAAAVNSSRDAKRLGSHRTHQQCKDRIDTLTPTGRSSSVPRRCRGASSPPLAKSCAPLTSPLAGFSHRRQLSSRRRWCRTSLMGFRQQHLLSICRR